MTDDDRRDELGGVIGRAFIEHGITVERDLADYWGRVAVDALRDAGLLTDASRAS